MSRRITVPELQGRKNHAQKFAALTAYDYSFAKMVDAAGVELILVGDSLGMVMQGHDSTLPVTMDEMIYHARCVARGSEQALLVGDLPFLSFNLSVEQALRNAGRFLAEGGMQAVKLEGGEYVQDAIHAIVRAGIPVLAHIGLTPQAVHAMGGFKVQGRSDASRAQILRDAEAVQEAGAFAVVLEGIPETLAAEITQQLWIPTIGIGASSVCDAQILVLHDLLGLNSGHVPKFVKRYGDFFVQGKAAIEAYAADVRSGAFPGAEHVFANATSKSVVPPAAKSYGPTE